MVGRALQLHSLRHLYDVKFVCSYKNLLINMFIFGYYLFIVVWLSYFFMCLERVV